MILVDIEVPAIEKVFNFELDEDAVLGEMMASILSLIAEQEGLKGMESEKMLLYSCRHEKILNAAGSLKEQGIWTGQRLMLI